MRNTMSAIVVLTLAMLITMTSPAYAQKSGGVAQVVLGRDVSLDSGQTLESSLIALGGSVTTASSSRIAGDLVVVGGDAMIRGIVQGSMLVVGGRAYLSATSQVIGRVVAIGGAVEREPGAQVQGTVTEIGRFGLSPLWLWGGWGLPLFVVSGWGSASMFLGIWRLFWAVVTAMGVAVISLLVVRFLPQHAAVMVGTIRDATAASFGVGLLTGAIGLIIIAVLIATVCLAPLGMILILPLALATLLGWTMVGYSLGQHLMPVLNRRASPEPMIVALVGTLVLTAGQQGLMVLSATPCLGFFFRFLGMAVGLIAAAIGLGAVVLSRFGTQHYPADLVPASPSPVAPRSTPPSETFLDEGTMDELSRRRPRRKKPGSETTSQEMRD